MAVAPLHGDCSPPVLEAPTKVCVKSTLKHECAGGKAKAQEATPPPRLDANLAHTLPSRATFESTASQTHATTLTMEYGAYVGRRNLPPIRTRTSQKRADVHLSPTACAETKSDLEDGPSECRKASTCAMRSSALDDANKSPSTTSRGVWWRAHKRAVGPIRQVLSRSTGFSGSSASAGYSSQASSSYSFVPDGGRAPGECHSTPVRGSRPLPGIQNFRRPQKAGSSPTEVMSLERNQHTRNSGVSKRRFDAAEFMQDRTHNVLHLVSNLVGELDTIYYYRDLVSYAAMRTSFLWALRLTLHVVLISILFVSLPLELEAGEQSFLLYSTVFVSAYNFVTVLCAFEIVGVILPTPSMRGKLWLSLLCAVLASMSMLLARWGGLENNNLLAIAPMTMNGLIISSVQYRLLSAAPDWSVASRQFVLFACYGSVGFFCFAWCQVFSYFYEEYATTELSRYLWATAFPFTLMLPTMVLSIIGRELDKSSASFTRMEVIGRFVGELFMHMFKRVLFFEFSELSTLVAVEATCLAMDLLIISGQMTVWCMKFYGYCFRAVRRTAKPPAKLTIRRLQIHRERIATKVLLGALAEMIAILVLLTCVPLLHVHNSSAYQFAADGVEDYNLYSRQMEFLGVLFVTGCLASFTLWAFVFYVYKIESICLTAQRIQRSTFLCILLAAHVASDIWMAANKEDF